MAERPSRGIADIWEVIAQAVPDSPALVCGPQSVAWREFDLCAESLGSALLTAGLAPGAKVAQYLYNDIEYLIAVFASFKAGMVPVNTNYRYTTSELAYLWENADVEAVVFHGSFADQIDHVRSELGKIRLWVWVDDQSGPCPPWAVPYDVLASDPITRCIPPGGRSGDDLYLLYTGGTTGTPKGVMWRQEDLFWYLNSTAARPIRDGAPDAEIRSSVLDGARPVFLIACPLMHGTGSLSAFRALGQGGTVILVPGRSFDVSALLDTVEREHAQTLIIVGDAFGRPILEALENSPGRWDISSLREIVSSGLVWSEDNKRALLQHNPSMNMVDSLASSEALGIGRSIITSSKSTTTATFELSRNAVLVDDDGRVVPPQPGASGRLAVRRSIPLGYYKDNARTRQTFIEIDRERFSIPGDHAMIERDGSVRFLGRGSHCINTGGEKVYPEEVEECLKTHTLISDAAVVGVADPRFGQSIVAMVTPVAGERAPTMGDVIDHVQGRLARYKSPRRILVVETIPRTPSGKVDYAAVHEQVRAR